MGKLFRWFFWIGNRFGGFEQRQLATAAFVKRLGHEVVLGFWDREWCELDFEQVVVRKPFKSVKFTGFCNALLSFNGKFLDGFDVVYGKFLIKGKTRAFVVCRLGGDQRKIVPGSFLGSVACEILRMFDRLVFRRADLVVACSSDAVVYLDFIGVSHYVLSSNFFDEEFFYRKKVFGRVGYVLFVGRDDPIKNLKSLRVACGELGVELKEVGTGEWCSNVSDLCDWYRGADVVVLPSFFESFGNVVLEGLACGTPVIASDKVGVSWILPKEFVCGTSVESIKERIRFVRDNKKFVDGLVRKIDLKDFRKDVVLKKEISEICWLVENV